MKTRRSFLKGLCIGTVAAAVMPAFADTQLQPENPANIAADIAIKARLRHISPREWEVIGIDKVAHIDDLNQRYEVINHELRHIQYQSIKRIV